MKHPMRMAPNEYLTSIIAGMVILGYGERTIDPKKAEKSS
jgi:hypothetical protein